MTGWLAWAASMSSTMKSKDFSWSTLISMPVSETSSGAVVRGRVPPPPGLATTPVL